jgi:hypothetical protein
MFRLKVWVIGRARPNQEVIEQLDICCAGEEGN